MSIKNSGKPLVNSYTMKEKIMKNKVVFLSFLLIILSSLACASMNDIKYKKTFFPRIKLKLDHLSLKKCYPAIKYRNNLYITGCRNPKKDTKKDYGVRTYLIEIKNSKPIILFESLGYMDVYSVKLDLFTNSKNTNAVIVAEEKTEFSEGLSIYLLRNRVVTYIGSLPISLSYKTDYGEELFVSAVPVLKIVKKEKQFNFSFDRKINFYQSGGKYRKIPKNKVKYVYFKGKLKVYFED